MITPEKLLEAAKQLEPQLQEWRRTLHRHPEVGFDLPQTKALVKKALTEMGYAPQDCGKCGVLALAGGKKPGKVILLRGDMDALPLQEESGEAFASEVPGNGAPGVKGAPKGQPVRVIKIGRNDPCPCGSGLKWKKCTCAKFHPEGLPTDANED